jgi:hypothetical protein
MDSTLYFTGIKARDETHNLRPRLCYCAFIVGKWSSCDWLARGKRGLPLALAVCLAVGICIPRASAQSQSQDNEIVTSLTGGRVILHFAKEAILFAAVDQPVEQGAPPPRVVDVDNQHIAILFGASEWRSLADPKPIRMDRNVQRISGRDPRDGSYGGEADPDLEQMGIAFLEKLRPLVSQLQRKSDFPADQPFFEMVVVGYGPKNYGPEAWTVEYRITQQLLTSRENFWQTRILRPRFTQIYPPEKHASKTLVEAVFPGDAEGPTLQTLLEGNDPRFSSFRSDAKLGKALDLLIKGQAQKVEPADAAELLRAAVPLLYPKQRFFLGKMEDQRGFDWILPPEEPVEKAEKDDKNRPAEAPSLRKRPND